MARARLISTAPAPLSEGKKLILNYSFLIVEMFRVRRKRLQVESYRGYVVVQIAAEAL